MFQNCLKRVVYINTVLALPCSYRLDRKGMLLKFLSILIALMYFKDRNWISKTVNCISCSVVCKIVFCSEFPDIPDNARQEREGEEEHRQLQSVMRFTQTQKISLLNFGPIIFVVTISPNWFLSRMFKYFCSSLN